MRRKKAESHESHDRWLVSYADFITLLFAFFVVMFATAQSDKGKAKEVSEAVRDALEHGEVSTAFTGVLHHRKPDAPTPGEKGAWSTPPTQSNDALHGAQSNPSSGPAAALPPDPLPKPADLVQAEATLRKGLDLELKSGKLAVALEQRGLVISLREAAFFASGDDAINAASYPMIEKVAAVILGLPNAVRLEGNTDSIPIHNSRFRSNWDLSAARSIAMLHIFADRFGVPTPRMAVAGYAENEPADSNDTVEGRGHNRRVDVVLLTAGGMQSEPAAPALKRNQP